MNSLPSGIFSHRFTAPGVYYYSSGYVDAHNLRLLQAVVKVEAREDETSRVSVSVGGVEARHVTGGRCNNDTLKDQLNLLHQLNN